MAETASQIHMSLQDLVENLRTILTEENVAKQASKWPQVYKLQYCAAKKKKKKITIKMVSLVPNCFQTENNNCLFLRRT